MSASELDRFETDLKSSDSMRDELVGQGQDVDAVIGIANAHGYHVTRDDVQERVAAIGGEMSEEQLDAVAGGFAVVVTGGGGTVIVTWRAK